LRRLNAFTLRPRTTATIAPRGPLEATSLGRATSRALRATLTFSTSGTFSASGATLAGTPRLRARVLQRPKTFAIDTFSLLPASFAPLGALSRRTSSFTPLGTFSRRTASFTTLGTTLGTATIRRAACAATILHHGRKFLEFFAAELAIVVRVESVEHFHRIGRTLGTPGSTLGRTTAAPCCAILAAPWTFTLFGSLGAFSCLGTLFGASIGSLLFVELPVAIDVELFDHALPHLGPIGFFVGCIFSGCRG
jgi:hypothetical protein